MLFAQPILSLGFAPPSASRMCLASETWGFAGPPVAGPPTIGASPLNPAVAFSLRSGAAGGVASGAVTFGPKFAPIINGCAAVGDALASAIFFHEPSKRSFESYLVARRAARHKIECVLLLEPHLDSERIE